MSLALIKLHSVFHVAKFNPVFLSNPSFKSSCAQKQSCRLSCPLQLLVWPNFKLQYKNLSFERSKSGQNQLNLVPELPCCLSGGVQSRRRHVSLRRRVLPPLKPCAADARAKFDFASPFISLAIAQSNQVE